jgi:DNA-binding CsgD family transcriptional regulator
MAAERRTTIGLKLAYSVAAYSYIGLKRYSDAAMALENFHTLTTDFILPDSIARASFAEIAVIAARDGDRAATDRIRSRWDQLGADAGFFLEDVTRPAWLVATCTRAGDTELARRAFQAIESLAQKNTQLPVAFTALGLARDALAHPENGPATMLSGHNTTAMNISRSTFIVRTATAGTTGRADDGRMEFDVLSARLAAVSDTSSITMPATPGRLSALRTDRISLSRRERDVAQLVERGMTNKQIAKQLGISPHTVNFHLRKIFGKLSISTRAELSSLVAGWSRSRD